MQHSRGEVVSKFTVVTDLDHLACRPYVKASTGKEISGYIGGPNVDASIQQVFSCRIRPFPFTAALEMLNSN